MTCNWKLIKSQAATNNIKNPSFEINITDGWTQAEAGAGGVWTHSTQNYIGVKSLRITSGTSTVNHIADVFELADDKTVYLTGRVRELTTAYGRLLIRDATNGINRATVTAADVSEWEALEVSWTNTTGGAVDVAIYLQNIADDSASNVWFDAIDAQIDTDTTYLDGDQPGCEWDGKANNSTSSRDADSWQGGIVQDLQDTYYFDIVSVSGADSPPVEVFGTDYAILAGETADGERIAARDLFLVGWVFGTTKAQMRGRIATLYDELKHWRSGQTTRNSDPVRIVYEGTYRSVALSCKYVRGFDGRYDGANGYRQRIAIMMRAQEDVWFESLNTASTLLDYEDNATANYVMGKIGGIWNVMGPPSTAAATGTPGKVLLHDGLNLYLGTDLDRFDGDTDLKYFCKWNDSAWVANGSGGEGTGAVRALARMPDGQIALGGSFINWGTVAAADYCILYDPNLLTYAALANGPTSGVYSLAVSPITGQLYAALATTVEYWNGAAWVDLVATDFDRINGIAFGPDGTLYAVGFYLDGGDEKTLFKSYASATWATIETGNVADEYFSTVATLSDGRVVLGGLVSVIGVLSVQNIATYNGQTFDDMNGGLAGEVFDVFINDNDEIHVGVGTGEAYTKIYNGSVWYDLDSRQNGAVQSIAFDGDDIYLAFVSNGTAVYSGDTTISTVGAAFFNPVFKITRSGGTDATLKYLQNASNGSEMYFDLEIFDGETITIDTVARTVKSDTGRRITGNPLAGSMLGTWTLNGGSNIVNLWVDIAGAPTITAIMSYVPRYDGVGGSEVA